MGDKLHQLTLTRIILAVFTGGLMVLFSTFLPVGLDQGLKTIMLSAASAKTPTPDPKDLRQDIVLLPYSPSVHALMAPLAAQLQARKSYQAKQMLQQYGMQNQCREDFYQGVAMTYNECQGFNEATKYLAEGLKKYPNSLPLRYLNAKTWLKANEPDMAEPELLICLKLAPSSAILHAELANVYNQQERYSQALDEIDKVLARDPSKDVYWSTKGNILYHLKRDKEALEAIDKAIAIQPRLFTPRKIRGQLLMRLGRYNDAIKNYLYLAKIEQPKNKYEPLTHLGECYMALKSPKEALTYFDLAITTNESWVDAHRGRLAALEALKDTKAAEQEKKSMRLILEDWKMGK
jgi:tetratricopeptide (TPR) repeat protein